MVLRRPTLPPGVRVLRLPVIVLDLVTPCRGLPMLDESEGERQGLSWLEGLVWGGQMGISILPHTENYKVS